MPTLNYMARVREIIADAAGDPECWSQYDHHVVALVDEMHERMERLELFERYSNSTIQGQVQDALDYRDEHGKFPFED